MPHEDIPLVIEERYPFQKLNGMKFGEKTPPSEEVIKRIAQIFDFSRDRIFMINSWTHRDGVSTVVVYHTGDHRSKVAILKKNHIDQAMTFTTKTMAASQCWKLDAEIKAVEKLRSLVTPVAYRYYVLTGTFLETSPRSKVTYLFRKLRPTLALAPDRDGNMRILAGLCLHPIGYYEGTWAGVMVPTDDVIAHLLMMRGDERRFWSKANHHPPEDVRAGL